LKEFRSGWKNDMKTNLKATDSCCSEKVPVSIFCEYAKEFPAYIEATEFIEKLSKCAVSGVGYL
jgi:hypothetical protein